VIAALAVAVFGALLAQAPSFMAGMRISLRLAARIALIMALMGRGLQAAEPSEMAERT
jgi:alpha-D-ribose 1-methylphosphonate 5-triphosphate synthase subunit PhnI